jgi:hypothetical protein
MTQIWNTITASREDALAAIALLGGDLSTWGSKFRIDVERGDVVVTISGRVFSESRSGQWYYTANPEGDLRAAYTGRQQYRFDDIACKGKGARRSGMFFKVMRELEALLLAQPAKN